MTLSATIWRFAKIGTYCPDWRNYRLVQAFGNMLVSDHKLHHRWIQNVGHFYENTLRGSRKYPYPPMEGICLIIPPPLWKFQLSFIHCFKFLGLWDPPPPWNFQSRLWGEYGYFLEPHITKTRSCYSNLKPRLYFWLINSFLSQKSRLNLICLHYE